MNYGEKIRVFLVLFASTLVLFLGIFVTIIISGLFLSPVSYDYSKETIGTYNNLIKEDRILLSNVLEDQIINQKESKNLQNLKFLNYNLGKIKIISNTYREIEYSFGSIYKKTLLSNSFSQKMGNTSMKIGMFIKRFFFKNKEKTCMDFSYIPFSEENMGFQFSCANNNVDTLRVFSSNEKNNSFIISTVLPIKDSSNKVLGFLQIISDAGILEEKLGKVLISILSPILVSIFLVAIFILYLQNFLSNKVKLNFLNANNIAHNLKNKTNAIRYYLNKNIKTVDDANSSFFKIKNILDNLDSFIESTLRIAKQEHYGNKKSEIFTYINFLKVIEIVKENYISHNILYVGNFNHSIKAEKYRLIESITAIIDNGLYWTTNNKLTVKAILNNNFFELHILDNGPGISKEIKNKVFNKGFSKSGGNGFGLYVAKDIIDSFGGNLIINNRPEGGTCMIIQLLKSK